MAESEGRGVLAGLRVVEFCQVVAGPLAGGLLADHGAEVIHVEAPERGDSARAMGPRKDGVPLWWKVSGRNKRSVTLNLHSEEGQEIAHRLVSRADVVIVSMRSSTLERWRLDWESLKALKPGLIYLQISGYGATSSLADAPGFGKMGEARSGVVHLTGFPDGPPIHTGFSHGDAVSGLMGAFGVLAALHRKDTVPDFPGERIDLALFEPLFRLIEWQVIVHDQLGTVPMRAGNQLAVAPASVINTYLTGDGNWVTVTSATRRSVENIIRLLGLPPSYAEADVSAEDRRMIDERLNAWIAARETEDVLELMSEAGVVASRVFSMAEIATDPIYAERNDLITIPDDELGPVRMQAALPHLSNHPGKVWRAGAALGADNELVYGQWLGLGDAARDDLAARGII